LTLALLALTFVTIPVTNIVLMSMDGETAIRWRPTAGWWLVAAFFWIASAASTRFLSALLWGDRLNLSPAHWLTVGRGLGLFFLALGLLNLAVWQIASTVAWVNFKLFWPLPMYAIFIAVLAIWLRRKVPSAP
jgi:intracellular septation protein